MQRQCDLCGKYFSRSSNLCQHIRRVHYGVKDVVRKQSWPCDICGRVLSSKRSMKDHRNSHLNRKPHKCDQCDYATTCTMSLKRHITRRHRDQLDWPYCCMHCSSYFVDCTHYQEHVRAKHPSLSDTFSCTDCDFKTLSSLKMSEHLDRHETGEILCPKSGVAILLRQRLLTHDYLVSRGGGEEPLNINNNSLSTTKKIILFCEEATTQNSLHLKPLTLTTTAPVVHHESWGTSINGSGSGFEYVDVCIPESGPEFKEQKIEFAGPDIAETLMDFTTVSETVELLASSTDDYDGITTVKQQQMQQLAMRKHQRQRVNNRKHKKAAQNDEKLKEIAESIDALVARTCLEESEQAEPNDDVIKPSEYLSSCLVLLSQIRDDGLVEPDLD